MVNARLPSLVHRNGLQLGKELVERWHTIRGVAMLIRATRATVLIR